MNVYLRNMKHEEYNNWLELSINIQADDRAYVNSTNKEAELEKLDRMLPHILPEGLNSKNNYFFCVDIDNQSNVGFIWFTLLDKENHNSIFLIDIIISDQHRSKGIGRIALKKAQSKMKDEGFTKIQLNVRNNNYAKNLYTSLGYKVIKEEEKSCLMELSTL